MNEDDSDFAILNSWFAVIGMITMFWSPAERFIDQILHIVHKSNDLIGKSKKPTRLGSKIEYIKNNLPSGLICNTHLTELAIKTRAAVVVRDVFVHGLIDSYNRDEIVITKVDGRAPSHEVQKFTYDFKSLNDAAMNLEVIRKEWAELALKLSFKNQNG